ncbi:MAG: hypothetical protein NTV88_05225 [Candidatus Micrarchaeota archaeon]|nr:hypothetical protein [Candidatus Micrarchaeota archaeon]
MNKTLVALLLFLALACSIAFAQALPDFNQFKQTDKASFENKLSPGYPNTGAWYLAAGTAIMIVVMLNGLLYMFGVGFNIENLKRYARGEMLQAVASALIIFFAVSMLYELSGGGAFHIMGLILGEGDSTISCAAESGGAFHLWNTDSRFGSGPIGAFKCKTQEKINFGESTYYNIFYANLPSEGFFSICYSIFGFPIFCYDWIMALHKEVETAHLLATKVVSMLVTLHAQYAAAEYVQSTMLTVFLPLGLVLRILPFTRGVGGLFIAIAIGFYFVFPTFFVLTDPTSTRINMNSLEQTGTTNQLGCFTGFKGAAVLLSVYSGTTQGFSKTQIAISESQQSLYYLTLGVNLYPFIAFVVALAFIRAATPLLGGDLGDIMKAISRLG